MSEPCLETALDRLQDAASDAGELREKLEGHELESLAAGLLIRIDEALVALGWEPAP